MLVNSMTQRLTLKVDLASELKLCLGNVRKMEVGDLGQKRKIQSENQNERLDETFKKLKGL